MDRRTEPCQASDEASNAVSNAASDAASDAEADPDGESVEAPDIGIIPLPWLVSRLIQVHHDRRPGKDKEKGRHEPLLPAPPQLDYAAQEPQEQRQSEQAGASGQEAVGQEGLIAQQGIVDEGNAGDRVAVPGSPIALQVVLPPAEIP